MGTCSSQSTARDKRRRSKHKKRIRPSTERAIRDSGRSIYPEDQHRGIPSVYHADPKAFEGPAQTYKAEHITNRVPVLTSTVIERPVIFKQAAYAGIYNMKVHHHDKAECRIRGAEFLPNGNLVVCDQANCNLKLWSATFLYLNHVKLPGKPHDLCVHSSNREGSDVFVTIPSERCILEFFVEEKDIKPGIKLRTDGWCYGIAPYKSGLVVCVGTKIVFLDPEGAVTKTWQYNKEGKSRFGSPFHIVVTPTDAVVISDSMRGCVLGLDAKGEEIFRYEEMTTPHDLLVDSLGNIFLCGADENSVDALHQITRDGEKVKSLLSWRHVGFKPDTLCFRERDQMMAVFGQSDRMKLFKLTTMRAGKIYSNDAIINYEVDEEIRDAQTTPEVQELMKKIYNS